MPTPICRVSTPERQRDEAAKALEQAKADGRQRAVAANQQIIQQLDTIITSLEREQGQMAAQTARPEEGQA